MFIERLSFLDTTLSGIIHRFEQEYPECRLKPTTAASLSDGKPESGSLNNVSSSATYENSNPETEATTPMEQSSFLFDSDVDDDFEPEPEVEHGQGTELESELNVKNGSLNRRKRHLSDVSLASRALAYEEGNLHKLSQHVQRGIMQPSSMVKQSTGKSKTDDNNDESKGDNAKDADSAVDDTGFDIPYDSFNDYYTPGHPEFEAIRQKLESLTGEEIRNRVRAQGYEETMRQIGKNAEALRQLEREQEAERSRNRSRGGRRDSVGANSCADAGANEEAESQPSILEEEYAKRRREAQLAAHVDILKLDDDGDKGDASDEGRTVNDDGSDKNDIRKEEDGKDEDMSMESSSMMTSTASAGSADASALLEPHSSAISPATHEQQQH